MTAGFLGENFAELLRRPASAPTQIGFVICAGLPIMKLMLEPLANSQIRKLKATAQRLKPMFKVGKAGLSEGFVQSVATALAQHELVKIKFVEFKDQKQELAPQLAERTASHLIMRVGNVLVLHRPQPLAETPAS